MATILKYGLLYLSTLYLPPLLVYIGYLDYNSIQIGIYEPLALSAPLTLMFFCPLQTAVLVSYLLNYIDKKYSVITVLWCVFSPFLGWYLGVLTMLMTGMYY